MQHDAKDWQTNFPIHVDAVLERGLDYLAIGDTHGFRYIPPGRQQTQDDVTIRGSLKHRF